MMREEEEEEDEEEEENEPLTRAESLPDEVDTAGALAADAIEIKIINPPPPPPPPLCSSSSSLPALASAAANFASVALSLR